MKLIIGGYAQGKLNYVLQRYCPQDRAVWDGVILNDALPGQTVILNHFHNWVRECLSEGGCPEKEILTLVEQYQDCIIISDELGNGIVPMEAREREYRERTGRILVELADRAEEVVRVICGLGQKIK